MASRLSIWALAIGFGIGLALGAAAPVGAASDLCESESRTGWHASLRVHSGPRLGVRVQPMTKELRDYFSVEEDAGVLVAKVESGSAAEEAGIRAGDVIVRLDDSTIRDPRDLARAVGRAESGKKLALGLVREGKRNEIDVSLPDADEKGWGWMQQHPRDLFGPHLERGLRMFREQLHDLERRLHELERRIEQPEAEWT